MIADFADLQRLSGRERPAAVKKWLQSQGISYMLNADGHPVTTEKALNEALLRGRKMAQAIGPSTITPIVSSSSTSVA